MVVGKYRVNKKNKHMQLFDVTNHHLKAKTMK
jgi:hypothetical protein